MEKIDAKTVLEVFQTVMDHGSKAEEGYHLAGLTATSDVDGYTVQLTDGRVTVRVMFHNSIDIDAPGNKDARRFMKKLEQTLQDYG